VPDIKVNYFTKTYTGCDMMVSLLFPQAPPITVGSATTVSYSTFRSLQPVVTMGRVSIRGFAKGTRTVAGTIVFSMHTKSEIAHLKNKIGYLNAVMRLRPDELPPFDILITAGNEAGSSAKMLIYGVTLYEEGQVISINEAFSESIWSYHARDVAPFDNTFSSIGQVSQTTFRRPSNNVFSLSL
jgi:hypothetical protein